MFTKNWYKVLASGFTYETISLTSVSGGSYNGLVNNTAMLSYAHETNASYAPSLHYVHTSYDSRGGVVFGTGTTPPTIDDYCLSGNVITGFSYSAVVNIAVDADGMTTTAVYTITNTSSEDITISEIGLIASFNGNSSASNKSLIDRTVLDSPVTIPAGGVGQVTYTIRFNYPTA